MDDALIARAERQHGAFTRQQLLADGMAKEQVSALLRRGRIVRRTRGTYTLPGTPPTSEQHAMVAALRAGEGSRVVGERMLGFLGIRGASPNGPFTVLTPPGRRLSKVDWPWRPDLAPAADHATIRRIPSASVARNLVEAVVGLGEEGAARLVDGVRWSPAGIGAVRSLVDRMPDHPGTRLLIASGLVAHDAGESPPERRMHDLLIHHEPQRQVWVAPRIRVDLLLPAPNLVLEYNGRWTHARAAEVRDTERRVAIQALGYAVLDVWDRDLRDEAAFVARVDTLAATLS